MSEAATSSGEVVGIQAVGTMELPSLRSEGERLKLERDNAQLRAELAQLGKPWWHKGSVVTTLTAIVAAVVPVTTAVQAHYQKERELVLQESKQAHEIRTSYLDRLDKPRARMRTLRFVLATTSDSALRSWAEEEKRQAQSELDEIDRKIAALEAEAKAEAAKASQVQNGLNTSTKPTAASSTKTTNHPASNVSDDVSQKKPVPASQDTRSKEREQELLRLRQLQDAMSDPP
jgi:hypothetical protein